MKNKFLIVVALVITIGGIAAFFYWPYTLPVSKPIVVQPAPPPAPPAPVIHNMIESPPAQLPLPALTDSDKLVLDALAGLVRSKSLMKIFHTDRLIHNIVATIDNLPGRKTPLSVLPVNSAPGTFITAGSASNLTIGAKNKDRYRLYVRITTTINARKLVGFYVRFYPLFQQAYQELGYPKKYFNDRLIVALNDLLAAPIIGEPVKLVQPNVGYQYADPDLERRSIGQRILMRLGSKNEDLVKTKLHKIKQELMRHMHQKRVNDFA